MAFWQLVENGPHVYGCEFEVVTSRGRADRLHDGHGQGGGRMKLRRSLEGEAK